MTEIIKNSKSISLDFIDNGGPGEKSPGSAPVFQSVYSNLELNAGREYNKDLNTEETEVEKKVTDFLENLALLDTKIEPVKILEIKELLLSFIKGLNLPDPSEATKGTKDDFSKLMNLLEKLEGLLDSHKLKVDIKENDKKLFLDQIRIYLNKKIIAKEETPDGEINIGKNLSKELGSLLIKKREAPNKDDSLSLKAAEKENSLQKIEYIQRSIVKDDKVLSKLNNNIPISATRDNKKQGKDGSKEDGAYRANQLTEETSLKLDLSGKKIVNKVGISSDIISKTVSNFKDTLHSDISSRFSDITPPKADQNSNLNNQSNNQSNFNFKSENSSKMLDTLNMLSKTWGNKLIEKIEKSIINGDEKLEISLSPKSLGRLNITINIQDALTRINIVAESASAAALLGESENKLSQMMESSGLKLSTLLTSSQQFGNNNGKNSKNRPPAKINNEKQEKVDGSDIILSNQKKISTKEGLNLIA